MDSPINNFSNINIKYIIHELNHAWNYEKGKRCNIFLLPIKFSDYKKYLYIMETINEAETQILCSEPLKRADITYDSKLGEFSGNYRIFEESIFKTLCIICNQNGIEFLRSIEGMDINQLISYISQKTGYSISETTNYLDKLGLLHYTVQNSYNKFYSEHTAPFLEEVIKVFIKEPDKSCRDLNLQNMIDDWLNKAIQIKEYIPEYQSIYEHSKEFISGINRYSKKDKQMALLKFENIQDTLNPKIISSFYKVAKVIDNNKHTNILKTYPNLKVVEHEESNNPNFNAVFELGKINSPDLIPNTEFQFSWTYRQENEVQKSLKGKKIFSRVTISSLRNIRKFLEQDLIKDLREGRQI